MDDLEKTFKGVRDLLLHPDSGHRRQGVTLLTSLDPSDLEAVLMRLSGHYLTMHRKREAIGREILEMEASLDDLRTSYPWIDVLIKTGGV